MSDEKSVPRSETPRSVIHFASTPFIALCGADENGQRTTGSVELASCPTCLEKITYAQRGQCPSTDGDARCVFGRGHRVDYHCDGDRRWPVEQVRPTAQDEPADETAHWPTIACWYNGLPKRACDAVRPHLGDLARDLDAGCLRRESPRYAAVMCSECTVRPAVVCDACLDECKVHADRMGKIADLAGKVAAAAVGSPTVDRALYEEACQSLSRATNECDALCDEIVCLREENERAVDANEGLREVVVAISNLPCLVPHRRVCGCCEAVHAILFPEVATDCASAATTVEARGDDADERGMAGGSRRGGADREDARGAAGGRPGAADRSGGEGAAARASDRADDARDPGDVDGDDRNEDHQRAADDRLAEAVGLRRDARVVDAGAHSSSALPSFTARATAFFAEHWDTYYGHPIEELAVMLRDLDREVRAEEREACAKALEAERELWMNEDRRDALEEAATIVRGLRMAKATAGEK